MSRVIKSAKICLPFLSVVTILLALPSVGTAQNLTNLKQPIVSAVSTAQDLGKLDDSTLMYITVSLPPVNKAAMEAFADSVSNPASPNFRHFLTPAQIGASYGQPVSVVNNLTSYLKSKGLKITLIAASNMAINATGTAAQVSAAFNTTIHKYHSVKPLTFAPADFYSNSTVLKLPSSMAASVQTVSGLSNYLRKKPGSILSPGAARSVYDALPLYNAGVLGQGRTVGVTNYGGYAISNIPKFYTQFSLPVPPGGLNSNVSVETVGAGNAASDDAECDLDMQMELGQVPLANLILYDCSEGPAEVLTLEANDNSCDVISESWLFFGFDPGTLDTFHELHVQMAIQGITYLTCSGDNGTSELSGDSFCYPQIDPYVVDVGGTTVILDSTGLHRSAEIGWGGGSSGASGGSWDPNTSYTFNTLPSYQYGPGIPTNIPFRLVPDVSLHAAYDINTYGAFYFFTGGSLATNYNGTSFSSPCFAGMLIVAEQKLIQVGTLTAANHYRFGHLNPEFYRILRSPNYHSVFYDVTVGTNGPLPNGSTSLAGPGWDFVTGMGSLDVNNFASYETPPIPLSATAVALFDNEGVESPAGQLPARISSKDGIFFTVNSVSSSIGQVASPEFTYKYTSTTEPVDTLSASLTAIVPKNATNFVYAYNVRTALWDLIGSSAGTGALTTVSYSLAHPSDYVATDGTIILVERALYPTRLGAVPFQLKVDSASVTVNQHTF